MEPFRDKKTVHYEINGKRYDRIEDIPPEFRDLLKAVNENPEAFKNSTIKKITTQTFVDVPGAGQPHEDHREKFLREAVLPNLQHMDPATQAEVLRQIGGTAPEKRNSSRRILFWIAFYGALGLLLKVGCNSLKNLFPAP